MGIFETFSKRQKKLKGELLDVFTYDTLSSKLRVQISHIWIECLGVPSLDWRGENPVHVEMHKTTAAELGRFQFPGPMRGHMAAVVDYFCNDASTEEALDIIDMSFQIVVKANRDWDWKNTFGASISSDQAVADLNQRFREHGVGYAFVGGAAAQLIKMDNNHLHHDVVIPALRLLHEEGFAGANDEYRSAHKHYRRAAYKECLNDCLKAFESTMKTICGKMKWTYKPSDTASALIDVCLNNGLLPPFMQTHLGTVKSALTSAIPTVRNKMGGHGQGPEPVEVPQYYAEYLLHETAATIVFLVDAYKDLIDSRLRIK